MAFSAILLFPKLAASAWASGSGLASAMPDQVARADVLGVPASLARLFALALPVAGVAMFARRLLGWTGRKAWGWSAGSAARRGLFFAGVAGLVALLTWAWWPSGQYRPVRPTDDGTLAGAFRTVSAPTAVARPSGMAAAARPAPGRHRALALIPRGGRTKEHPALYVVNAGEHGKTPTILVSPDAPDARKAPSLDRPATDQTGGAGPAASGAPAGGAATRPPSGAPSTPTVPATQLPFKLPDAPKAGASQALATNTTAGGIVYDVAYSLVTVTSGDPVENENSAYALASCNACTTLAVSFQPVLVVGHTDKIAPINVAEGLNRHCPECITTASSKQIIGSLRSAPCEHL